MMSHPRAAYCRTRYNGKNQVRSELSLSVTEIIASGIAWQLCRVCDISRATPAIQGAAS